MPSTDPLEPELIVAAYCQGIFPMADETTGEIGWYSPDPRAIFPLESFHVPRSLRRTIRRGVFELRVDTAFEEVMRACADREETWISEALIGGYTALHRRGFAHSVEAWCDGELAGGLYGVSLGGAFMGESMFTRITDASKVCLVHLVERLRAKGFVLLDSQLPTEHLSRFGQIVVPREEYLRRLAAALRLRRTFA
ncbi:MAG TPA: leucyl/phenylalanyl-tRNA--protein transferase [Vulgatibacter sp.]|nr:leucyl/phenylalanyl-tRNA--protein transferase [Vulgatibacter sp.]